MLAGADSIRCSTISVSAVYWLSGEHTGALREEGGQPRTQGGVGETVEPAFREHTDHGDRRPRHVHRQGNRCPLKVGAGDGQLVFREKHRIVSDAVQLNLDLFARERNRIMRCPNHLW
jgi:hypothetical protein